MISPIRIKNHWVEQRTFMFRSIAAGVIVTALVLVVAVRLFVLQVLDYEIYAAQSEGNRIRIEPVAPTRGLIYDRNGVVLAENLPVLRLELTPEQVPDVAGTLDRLEDIGLLPAQDRERAESELASKRNRPFEAVPLRLSLTDEEVARFAVQRPFFPGVEIQARLRRNYPFGQTTIHAIGYVGSIAKADLDRADPARYAGTSLIGKIGVESERENILHGMPGYEQRLVNVQGRRMGPPTGGDPPRPGDDVILTLDIRLQQVAEEALGDFRGAIVALDPRNGDVLAFVSTPGYDPNAFGVGLSAEEFRALQNDPDQPMFNRALRGHYAPGSTIKPVIALAGLHLGTISPAKSTFCPGYFMLRGRRQPFRDWRRGGHGKVGLSDAITRSCDVFFYELAHQLGIDPMHDFLTSFGFGRRTGIELAGEKEGLVPSTDWKRRAFSRREDQTWFPGETVIAGIGQGFMLATPLQMAYIAATLANRGKHFTPRIVQATRDGLTGELTEIAVTERGAATAVGDAHWDQVLGAMEAVVHDTRGTAYASGLGADYRFAGKTGTSQVISLGEDEEYDEEATPERLRDHALFISFAPVQVPEIALAVIVENGGGGGRTAAPMARKLLDQYFSFINE